MPYGTSTNASSLRTPRWLTSSSAPADHSLDALVFRSREGTPLTTADVRRQLRKVLGDAGIEGVSPHMFRRTVATVINEQVNPLTAELLDQAFARTDDE